MEAQEPYYSVIQTFREHGGDPEWEFDNGEHFFSIEGRRLILSALRGFAYHLDTEDVQEGTLTLRFHGRKIRVEKAPLLEEKERHLLEFTRSAIGVVLGNEWQLNNDDPEVYPNEESPFLATKIVPPSRINTELTSAKSAIEKVDDLLLESGADIGRIIREAMKDPKRDPAAAVLGTNFVMHALDQ